MLVLPEGAPKGIRDLKVYGYRWFHIWGIYLPLCDIWRGKNTQYNFIYEN